jgi:hypothetical protein
MERQELARQQAQDTKILQKVNAAHRDVFLSKYPQQTEHCLRLTMERLQACLDKRDGCDVGDPDTWRAGADELESLARAAYYLNEIRQGF